MVRRLFCWVLPLVMTAGVEAFATDLPKAVPPPFPHSQIQKAQQVVVPAPAAGAAVPATVTVPDLFGVPRGQVATVLQQKTHGQLTLGNVREQQSSQPIGTVISQSPVARQIVKRGTTVNLVVAIANPQLVPVPDLVGLLRNEAATKLSDKTHGQLSLGEVREQNNSRRPNEVISQKPAFSPAAVVSLAPGSKVDIIVSKAAPPMVSVPYLINHHLDVAKKMITDGQLRLGTVQEQDNNRPPGTVIQQTPRGDGIDGLYVAPGSRIDVVVARARPQPPPVTPTHVPTPTATITPVPLPPPQELVRVPLLTRRSEALAVATLKDAGLSVGERFSVESSQTIGTVINQFPLAGTQVQPGSRVQISVAIPIKSPPTVVPPVKGLDATAARQRIEKANLKMQIQIRASIEPPNRVLEQTPVADTKVVANSVVQVWLSDASLTRVPSLIGKRSDEVTSLLNAATLQPGTRTEQIAAGPAGSVINQIPAAGAEVKKDSAVNLFIARQPTVPQVTGLLIPAAQQALESNQLRLGARTTVPGKPPRDKVFKQLPAAGSSVSVGTPVNVEVSDGTLTVVPNLAGLPHAQSTKRLSDAGLKLGQVNPVETLDTRDKVRQQQPPAGASATRGSAVAVWVSVAPTVPDVRGKPLNQAQALLAAKGLQGKLESERWHTEPKDTVLGQRPAPGSPASATAVALDVSKGMPAVPGVIGMTLQDAQTMVEAVELKLAPAEEKWSIKPKGTIIGQEPAVGQTLAPGESMRVQISSGPFPMLALVLSGLTGLGYIAWTLWPTSPPQPTALPPPQVVPHITAHLDPLGTTGQIRVLSPAGPPVQLSVRIAAGESVIHSQQLIVDAPSAGKGADHEQ
jgi:beta-lactam-binding protein with PASTA domain